MDGFAEPYLRQLSCRVDVTRAFGVEQLVVGAVAHAQLHTVSYSIQLASDVVPAPRTHPPPFN